MNKFQKLLIILLNDSVYILKIIFWITLFLIIALIVFTLIVSTITVKISALPATGIVSGFISLGLMGWVGYIIERMKN